MNILFLIISYFLGSIPFSLLIGKIFYKKDLRNEGSGNLGATNTFRVLGKKPGIIVALLDISKGFLAVLLASNFTDGNINLLFYGVLAILGHALSIFIKFKGGKSVATTFGVFLFLQPKLILFTILIFLVFIILTKIVSLSSMVAITGTFIISCFTLDLTTSIFLFLITVFIIYKHKSNIVKILNGTENKIFQNKK